MQMEGLKFAIPAEFVTFLTIGVGGIFVLKAWTLVFLDRATSTKWRIPTALYPFSVSVGMELAGLIVLEHVSYKLMYQEDTASFIWSCFLTASFVLVLASLLVVKWDSGPAKHTVRMGSVVLLVIAVLGLIWYIA